ncbi:MAG: carboxypeptidase regulatory-like domain-containing protein [Terracidiphilus sp.]
MRFPRFVPFVIYITLNTFTLFAQSPDGNINGLVSDPSGAAVIGAEIVAVNDLTSVQYTTKTNNDGIYVLPNLPPGPYRLQVSKIGFKTIIKPDIVLNVQDALAINFTLPVGAFHEVMTVEGGASLVNTESAAVSTVVDRQFAENLPMNGRSFQTLIELTPGVVVVPSNLLDSGQFSVDGQRASSNYWTVDGVSANIGMSAYFNPGNSVGGTLGSFSALGGTNSLVSVDALQEFRIQTSTYAPEFGRTPGGQISIVTRSGTNQFHGTLFDYLRNDVLDANDWFADNAHLAKPEERQNDFGGTLSGPIHKDQTFFFFSYEGLRLRLPQVEETTVPSIAARQNAIPAIQPYLNAYPVPAPGAPDEDGISPYNASFSNAASLDAYSLRVDHHFNSALGLFGRYDYSPSQIVQRGGVGGPLNEFSPGRITTQTVTIGEEWAISPIAVNDLRFNYSRTNSASSFGLDAFGGATPPVQLPFPDAFTPKNAFFSLDILSLTNGYLSVGKNVSNLQRQLNLVDSLTTQKGSHTLKFGVDFRRLTPLYGPRDYDQDLFFNDVPSTQAGSLAFSVVDSYNRAVFCLHNLGVFAQDTWKVVPRLVLTFGLRWDVDFSPSTLSGPNLPAVLSFNELATLALAPQGTPPFKTTYGNVAPRIGVAYGLQRDPKWQSVIRGGFGVFFDLATSEVGNFFSGYPFTAFNYTYSDTFPLTPATAAPPGITPQSLASSTLSAYDPNLELPYTLEWNLAVEQTLGQQQSLTASYVGSAGRRLLQTAYVTSPNGNFGSVNLVSNAATSDYDALQVQFQRRLSSGLQALTSYTWSHSIDTASAGSIGVGSNAYIPGQGNRGSSDFDIRQALSAAVTYEIPAAQQAGLGTVLLHGWSLQSVLQVRTPPPVQVYIGNFASLSDNYLTDVRPDVVPSQPFYLYGPQFPGGKALNAAAFTNPPVDPASGLPIRQGDLPRNALRGFGATQWDFALHRDFPIRESVKMQFRAELFNILNHPNLAPPVGNLSSPQFGQSVQMLGRSLGASNLGGGGFDPLYQIGGPRSIQLALKLMF